MYIFYKMWYSISILFDRIKFAWQRAVRGYDDTAYWSLASYITEIALPVLKRYAGNDGMSAYPIDDDIRSLVDWKNVLNKMIRAFQLSHDYEYAEGEFSEVLNTEKYTMLSKEMDEGFELFGKYFRNLWD